MNTVKRFVGSAPLDVTEAAPANGNLPMTPRDLALRTEAEKIAWYTRIFQSWSVI